eukprot:jgi/Botrbrau1/20130/Bobra.0173s0032.1
MGKRLKRGKAGNAAQYITRNQVLKKLQLRLSEFRRLCILKGIHPRDPRKKTQGNTKTYYHIKDINFLAHEPLLNKFRDIQVYEKKIRKAKAKANPELAERLQKRRPTFRLDHLVKERYPTFADALRDLDDALTLVHLFATLPADAKEGIPAKAVALASRLALEWQAYVARTASLRAAFISVKGFYFQAVVHGQKITWLVPHQLSQVVPQDVDLRVMLTFLDFYNTLLQFVNYKLYQEVGARYPPFLEPRLERAAQSLAALMQDLASSASPSSALALPEGEGVKDEDLQERLQTLPERLQEAVLATTVQPGQATTAADVARPRNAPDLNDVAMADALEASRQNPGGSGASEAAAISRAGPSAAADEEEVCGTLFRGLRFFLGREVPKEQLLLVLRAFGAEVGWEGAGSPFSEQDDSITHQVVDRPRQSHRFLARIYIQPQWVFDSANFRVLADAELYVPGARLPPHPSPFALDDSDAYVPDYVTTLRRLQEAAQAARGAGLLTSEAGFLEEAERDPSGEPPAAQTNAGLLSLEAAYAAELARELQGGRGVAAGTSRDEEERAEEAPQARVESLDDDDDDNEEKRAALASHLLPRKKRLLYNSIVAEQASKKARKDKLHQRKLHLQAAAAAES